MRIDAFNKVSQLYNTGSVKSTAKATGSSFHDKLEISQTGKDYHTVKQALANMPDVREDKVADIKEKMASGTYDVSMEEVADKLVNRFFDELA